VQRFYQTRLCRSVWRKVYPPFVWLAKIPITAAPKTGFPLRFNTLLGYFGIVTTALRAVVPHFRFNKDLILYLNSSRAESSGEFKFNKNPSCLPAIGFALGEAGESLCLGGKYFLFRLCRVRDLLNV
jgi:hypothetical protein